MPGTDGVIERTPASLIVLPERQLKADVLVTSAQLLALNATPKTLIAAPGSGLTLIFESAWILKPAGTAYAGIAAGEDLAVTYTNGAGLEVARFETTGFLDQATVQRRFARAYAAASAINDINPTTNAALVLSLLVGEITTGNSDLHVRVFYRIVADAAFAVA